MLLLALILVVTFSPTLRAQAPLKAVRAVVSQSEDGEPLETGSPFQAGESVFFSFQVENYKIGQNGKVQLSGHVDAFDPKGIPIAARDEVQIGTSVSEEDKNWKPKLRSQIQIPSLAPPGNYRIRYEVTDQQTHQTASGELAFAVGGRAVEPASSLIIRNLGFYHTQDESAPLRNAAYQPGDMLWVRFDVTGYKYGDQNSIDVAYDVAVLDSSGKQMFAQENAAVEKSQAFYPQPWVPAEFNLTLQSTMSRGTYTLVITAHDETGHQTTEARAAFKVE
jgi:methionine-rich copper-binding protein CopC